MTISTTTNRATYTGNGVTVAFSFPYAFFAQADLVVVETIIATGVQTTKTLTTHYTISGSVDALGHYSSGGTVTAVTAPASTVTWTIYRDPTATQTTDLVENDPMPAESIEAALDYQTMLNQRTRDIATRCLQQPEGDSATIDRLPAKVDRASRYLGFDADGDPVATAGTTSDLVATPYIETLLDDADATAALATLGAKADAMTTARLLGRTTASTGAIEEISVAASLTLSAGSLSGTAASTIQAGVVELASQTEIDAATPVRALTTDMNLISNLAQVAASGTAIDFTIPAGARRVTVQFTGFSLSGTDDLLVQVGDSGGVGTTGYESTGAAIAAAGTTVVSSTAGFIVKSGVAANIFSGIMTLTRHGTANHDWVASYAMKASTTVLAFGGGHCTAMAGTGLTTIRVTRTGTDTLDFGEVSVSYER